MIPVNLHDLMQHHLCNLSSCIHVLPRSRSNITRSHIWETGGIVSKLLWTLLSFSCWLQTSSCSVLLNKWALDMWRSTVLVVSLLIISTFVCPVSFPCYTVRKAWYVKVSLESTVFSLKESYKKKGEIHTHLLSFVFLIKKYMNKSISFWRNSH